MALGGLHGKRLADLKSRRVNRIEMSKQAWIYCLRGNDGSYYYGSTTKGVKKRYWDHKTRAKHMTEMQVYKHFNELGWDNVIVEEIESFIGTRSEQIRKENDYIMPRLNDPFCLNSKCSKLTPDEKKEHQRGAQQKYEQTNKTKRNQHSRDYYYIKKYGMNEYDYKNQNIA